VRLGFYRGNQMKQSGPNLRSRTEAELGQGSLFLACLLFPCGTSMREMNRTRPL
jgi:hypothetical protein